MCVSDFPETKLQPNIGSNQITKNCGIKCHNRRRLQSIEKTFNENAQLILRNQNCQSVPDAEPKHTSQPKYGQWLADPAKQVNDSSLQ